MEEKFKLNGPCRGLCAKGCGRQNKQLNTYDYLADIPGNAEATDLVEVQFRTRARDITTIATVCRWKKATSWPWKPLRGMTSVWSLSPDVSSPFKSRRPT